MSSSKTTEEVKALYELETRLKFILNSTDWDLFTSANTFVPIGIEIKSQVRELTQKVTKEIYK